MTSFAGANTPFWYIWVAIFLIGAGQGASMQNLLLAVQNTVKLRDIGASTATVTFFRSLGGAVGVQVAGIAFAWDVQTRITRGFARANLSLPPSHDGSMNFDGLPAQAVAIMRNAYGDSIGIIFGTMTIAAIAAVIAAAFMKGSRLRETIDEKQVHDKIRQEKTTHNGTDTPGNDTATPHDDGRRTP